MSLDEITTATENWRRVAGHLNEELKQNFKSGLTKLPSSHSNSNQLTRKFTSTSNNADTSLNSIGAINDIDMANIGQDQYQPDLQLIFQPQHQEQVPLIVPIPQLQWVIIATFHH